MGFMKVEVVTSLNYLVRKLSERKTFFLLQSRRNHFSGQHCVESEMNAYVPQIVNQVSAFVEVSIIHNSQLK